MIIAVIVFFIMAGLFGLAIFYTGLTKSVNEAAEAKALSAISNLAKSPEFTCVGSKPNCVDGDKIIALAQRDIYKNFWPFSSLRVMKISGLNKSKEDRIDCTMANYPNCEVITVYDKEIPENGIQSFVALCFTQQEEGIAVQRCEMGVMIAGTKIVDVD